MGHPKDSHVQVSLFLRSADCKHTDMHTHTHLHTHMLTHARMLQEGPHQEVQTMQETQQQACSAYATRSSELMAGVLQRKEVCLSKRLRTRVRVFVCVRVCVCVC
jgi:hypothetical protein